MWWRNSPSWGTFTGQSFEEFKGKGWLDAVHPDDRERVLADWREAVSTQRMYSVEYRLHHVSGEWRWMAARGAPILTGAGTVRQWVGMNTDITEQRRAEDALKASELRYRQLYERSPLGYQSLDISGRIITVNQAWLDMFGYTSDEVIGRPFTDFLPPDQAALFHERCSRFKAAGKAHGEFQVLRKDGVIVTITLDAQADTGADGNIKQTHCVLNDVTERRLRELERQQHLRFFESLDLVNRAMQSANDLEHTMGEVLEVLLSIFNCDRAFLLHPCDPDADFWQVPIESTRPEYPGALAQGVDVPMGPDIQEEFRQLTSTNGPCCFGPGAEFPLPEHVAQRFGFKSMIAVALHPKVGKRWVFGLHQCSHPRVWTEEERRLVQEIGRRLTDGLSSLLSLRDLKENEEKYREIFDNVSDSLVLYDVTDDRRFRLVDMNPVAERINGTARSAALNKFFEGAVQPERVAQSLPYFRQCVETGKPVSYEEHLEFGARPRQLDTVLLPVRNETGAVYRVIAFNRDVTERTRMITSLRKLSAAVEQSPVAVLITDIEGTIQYANPAYSAISGYSLEELLGQHSTFMISGGGGQAEQPSEPTLDLRAWTCIHEDGSPFPADEQPLMVTARTGEPQNDVVLGVYKPDGKLAWLSVSSSALVNEQDGKPYSYMATIRDITERTELHKSLRQLSAAVEQSPVAVLITDADGLIQYVNPAFTVISGYSAAEVLGQNPRIVHGNGVTPEENDAMWAKLKAGGSWQGTFHNKRKNGTRYWQEAVIAPIFDARGAITHFVGIQQDVTARKEAEDRLEFLAQHDALTGLPNRLLAKDRMEWAIAYADRSRCLAALIYIDIDGFKRINDSLGHAAGDALLKAVAARLQLCIRKTDTICRQGGDEFLLVLPEISDAEVIAAIASSAMEHLTRPFFVAGKELAVTISLGIAVYPDDGDNWDAIFKKAEIAMYSAKDAGRNTYKFFTEELNQDADEYLRLRGKLHTALERNEFELYYQPQINLKTEQVSGVEALIRWNSPELGWVPPGRFIPLAEDSGLIVPIGDWVLKQACQQAVAWQREGLPNIVMAVNLSAVQFRSGDVLASVRRALTEAGLDPAYLELEMTESILIKDTANVLSTVHQLKALGVTLSIDDFGTGYSSLSYLKRFNADKVKIDQSFVRDIATDANSAAIVNAIVQMARSLGLTTIAEGVEDEEVLDVLRARDCDEVQGYYYAKPMPAAEVSAFLRRAGTGRALPASSYVRVPASAGQAGT